jgi:SAM-dependent methyltransferase
MRHSPVAFAKKAGSTLIGLASRHRRIESAGRLLGYSLYSLPMPELKSYLHYAPTLPEASFKDTRLFPTREGILSMLPKGAVVAEVGVLEGDYSRRIVEVCQPREFHLIDIDTKPLKPVSGAIVHEGDSASILGEFADGYFDWLYIDGDHSYEGVKRDLAQAHRVLKSGGLMVCNDWSNWCPASAVRYGVMKAVNELVIEEGYQVRALGFHPAGLHDLLIQKP